MDAQYKKGILELCVLSLLVDNDMYGYQITDELAREMDVSAGTLYLVLKRIKDNGYVETYLVESSSGPARKYYHITEKGLVFQKEQKQQWLEFTEKVRRLL